MYENAYTKNYYDHKTGYPRYVKICETPPAKPKCASTLFQGDLVTWKAEIREDISNGRPRYEQKVVGTVVESRWTLMDWDSAREERTHKNSQYYPEAVVMWNDGETTNTSHSCLDKVIQDVEGI